jgi:hypothetical protein
MVQYTPNGEAYARGGWGEGTYKLVRKHAIAAGLGEQGQAKLEAVLFLGSSTRSEPPAAPNPLEHEADIARVCEHGIIHNCAQDKH